MGMRAQHWRLAHNEAQRNDSPPSATDIPSRVAFGVALGVQRDVPGERRVLGARVLALSRTRPPVFRTRPCWLHFAGPPGHRGSRRAESSKPRRGRSAWRRGPTDRVACRVPCQWGGKCSKQVLCEGWKALPVTCRREANPFCGGPLSGREAALFWRLTAG
jgi:hypothetical protein